MASLRFGNKHTVKGVVVDVGQGNRVQYHLAVKGEFFNPVVLQGAFNEGCGLKRKFEAFFLME